MIKINITLQNYNEALNKFNTNLLDNDLDQFIFNNCKQCKQTFYIRRKIKELKNIYNPLAYMYRHTYTRV